MIKIVLISIRVMMIASVFFPISTRICIAEGLQTGFGGIEWATPLEKVGDCERIEARGDIQYCARPNQMHSLLGEPTPEVLYGFYKEAFFSVFFRIEDDEAYMATKNRLVQGLGTPETALNQDGNVSILRWTREKVRVELHNDRSKEGFRLMYYYQPLSEKALRAQKMLSPTKWSKIKVFPAPKGDVADNIGILQF